MLRRIGLRLQPPGRIGGMGAGLHPDARLDAVLADLVAPHRDRVVEVKGADANVARRSDGAALPSIGEQRPGARAVEHGGICLGEEQPASERRCDRCDQQAVIAPGQAAGEGAAGITAASVRKPPFTSLGLAEIAANGARELNWAQRGKGHREWFH
jgi:hypothetical protein